MHLAKQIPGILPLALVSLLLTACVSLPKSGITSGERTTYHYGVQCQQHQVEYPDELKQAALQLISRYSPEGIFMIQAHQQQASKVCGVKSQHFASFINQKESKTKGLNYLISLTTSVHEMAHNFTSMQPASKATAIHKQGKYYWIYLDSPKGELAYYLPDMGVVYVPTTRTYPARLMDSHVPEALKDFIYQQYIAGQHGSNVIGVYALLDEFHAYYHDHQMSERMLRSKQVHFFEPGDYLNFLYFKYYMLAYLQYGQQYQPDIYQDIINNQSFVRTLLAIHDRFETLHQAHLRYRRQHKMNLGKGRYQHRGKTIVYPGLDEKYRLLSQALNSPELIHQMKLLRETL